MIVWSKDEKSFVVFERVKQFRIEQRDKFMAVYADELFLGNATDRAPLDKIAKAYVIGVKECAPW